MNKIIEYTIFIDGASSGNPGDAAVGVVIENSQNKVIEKISQYIGIKTNNFAEYTAMLIALRKVIRLGAQRVFVKSDSELLVKQLNGQYKVKNENLKALFIEAQILIKKIAFFSIEHVRREFNKQADSLAKNAIIEYRRANRVVAAE